MNKAKKIEVLKAQVEFFKGREAKLRTEKAQLEKALEEIEMIYQALVGGVIFAATEDGKLEIMKSDINDVIIGNKKVLVTPEEDRYIIVCK